MCAAPNTNWPGIQYTQQIIPIPKVEYTDTNGPTTRTTTKPIPELAFVRPVLVVLEASQRRSGPP